MLSNNILFLRNFLKNPTTIGSLLPSSKWLVNSLLGDKVGSKPKRYLEIGAGSGALTKTLVQKLHKEDQLDVVEIDPHFCSLLTDNYGHLPNVTIHMISITEFSEKKYDAIFSSLPLNAFPSELVAKIFAKYKQLLKNGGHLSYFEYIGFEKLKAACLLGKTRADFKKTIKLKRKFLQQHCIKVEATLRNVPPAKIYHCQVQNRLP